MFCYKCGKKIPSDGVFCPYCGTKQNTVSVPEEKKVTAFVSSNKDPSNIGFVIVVSIYEVKQLKQDTIIPDWARKEFPDYEHRVVLWDLETRTTASLFAYEALDLLDDCKSSDRWKEEGIPICINSFHLNMPSQYSKKGIASKEKKADEVPEEKKTELFRIKGKDAELFVQALEDNKKTLEAMSEQDEKHTKFVLASCYKIIFDSSYEQEEKKVDLRKRQLPWKNERQFYWKCEAGDFTGIVSFEDPILALLSSYKARKSKRSPGLSLPFSPELPQYDEVKFNLYWIAQVKSAERNYFERKTFHKLEEALEWVEKEILSLKDKPVSDDNKLPQKPEKFVLTEEYRQKLAPYWIDPSTIDPENLTYQSLIELKCAPESSEVFTMLSGKQIETNYKYPSAANLAVQLGLADTSIKFEQVVPEGGWYRAASLTRFYSEESARNHSQNLWDKSSILKLFKEGVIVSARYGYQEVETEYSVFLGECSPADKPRSKEKSREEYLAYCAMRFTLINALDVYGFRSFLGLPVEYSSDEDTLRTLHEIRAECKYVPANASAESLIWLRSNEVKPAKAKEKAR